MTPKTYHFIGIGGIGMSGIARLLLSQGHRVQGSDAKSNDLLAELEAMGAKIFIGHDVSYVQGADVVVYSSSISPEHPERAEAKKRGLTLLHRSEALAELCRGKFMIAVSGTHGKTTTTGLIGTLLKEVGRDPSVVVGGVVRALGGNARWGSGPEMVIEADESDSSFLNFSPNIAVLTNIEAEHLDHFKDVEQIEKAFAGFLSQLDPKGVWFGCAEDPRVAALAKTDKRARLYGIGDVPGVEWTASNIAECPEGRREVRFTVSRNGRKLGDISLKLLGKHNVLNALAAVGVGTQLGIPFEKTASALGCYEGAGRRFDVRYEDKDYLVVEDYAHHPTEIQKTLEAARGLKKSRIVALFQPHRFSRTELLMRDFGRSFAAADKLIITDIYAASEKPRPGVSGKSLYEEVVKNGHRGASYAERGLLAAAAKEALKPGDLVLVMGAGDIGQVAEQLSETLRHRQNGAGIFAAVRGKVLEGELLSRHTTLKIGGPAQYWIEPEDEEDLLHALEAARRASLPVLIFGAGSNLLAPDEGMKGAVLHLGAPYFKAIRMEGETLIARAGAPNTLFIQSALQQGLGGCEFLMGIPGNIGGAVAMNAGSHGQSIAPIVRSVRTLGFDGRIRERQAAEIPFTYRHCGLKEEIVLEAVFTLPRVPQEMTQKKLDEYRQYRASTQDLRHPSAGCMFKNPETPGCSSGRLIDEAGLKGFRVGQAQVSEKHANFIINTGGATARDVQELIEHVRKAVREKFDIELQTEVKILGGEPALLKEEKIAVLAGGTSCEREVSLVSGKNVFEALTSRGYKVLWVDAVGDYMEKLKAESITLAFIALHGSFGEDGTVQRELEKEGIRYTGPGPLASELAFDKSLSQALFQKNGVRVPEFAVYTDIREAARPPFALPLVVKPSKSGSSVGITIVSKTADYPKALELAFQYSDSIVVETFIRGRELTVGILGDEPLPVVEVIAQREFYDYEAKYRDSGTRYEVPAKLSEDESKKVTQEAMRAYRALGAEKMSRVDLILSEDGQAYVLEVNTIPGLTSKSLLPKAAREAGIDFPELCVRILAMALTNERTVKTHG